MRITTTDGREITWVNAHMPRDPGMDQCPCCVLDTAGQHAADCPVWMLADAEECELAEAGMDDYLRLLEAEDTGA